MSLRKPSITWEDGSEVELTEMEQRLANAMEQRIANDLGYEINITTLTTIMKKITEQKFFEVMPADYLPVVVGEGAWSSNLVTYRSFEAGGQFEEGMLNTGNDSARLASADSGVDSVSVKVFNWAKQITWTIMDLEQAAKAGNWDIVTSKERARKRNWDLGVQRVAFLGARGQNDATQGTCRGLLNQAGIETNTSVITKPISSMSTTELKTFQKAVIEAYRANCSRSAWPSALVIPESDYLGLVSQASPDFPIKSTFELLQESFAAITGKKDFKILPLAYADKDYHADVDQIAGKQVYTMLNYDEESIRMNIPVDYTNTLANSLNNFSFQNVGYGQFTGVQTYRPAELLYFQY